MNKTSFFAECPKTRAEFIKKYHSDYVFKNYAQNFGFCVVGECVILPNGMVANSHVK